MKILFVSDEESASLWDYYTPDKLAGIDMIISCGDLKSSYLQFLVTVSGKPLLYVQGNHDTGYASAPPYGCDCIEDAIVEFNGYRIMGLGGCRRYHPGTCQFTEREMARRIRRMWFSLKRCRGVDILVTHSPPEGLGDDEDPAHRGFQSLRAFLDKWKPAYMVHGHVHMSYDATKPRVRTYETTTLINAYDRYVLELPDREVPVKKWKQLIWKTRHREHEDESLFQRERF